MYVRCWPSTSLPVTLPFALPDMSANDPGFILFGQKMSSSSASSQIPANSPPEHDWGSSKKSEVGMPATENSERQNEHQKNNEATKISSSTEEFKLMKKPDKIQQCPRCNSMDTKFCYFNNYNVNQPRHFCKSCHRYWTAGGAMRNVPVGAGRRRNRQLSSPYHRHTSVSSEGIPVPTPNTDSSSHQHFSTLESTPSAFKSSPADNTSTLLRFGPDIPASESSVISSGGGRGNEVSELAMQWHRGVSNLMNTSNGVRCYPAAPWVFPAQWYAENKIGTPNIPVQFVAAPCWSDGNVVSIGPNGRLSSSSSASNGPALGKH